MTTILITSFGPFPGAPFNPTGPLVARLARLRRPALAGVRIVTHIFPTSYAAVDRELPALLGKYRPDALLMFGLASRTRHLRVETRARNALSRSPDVGGVAARAFVIAPGRARSLMLPVPARELLAAARGAHVPAALSREAGNYLCNYLCWRSAETARKDNGPRLAAFIHVPDIWRGARPRGRSKRRRLTLADLSRAGSRMLCALVAAARR